MRFYSGTRSDGSHHHHDIALVENTALPKPPENWSMFGMPVAVNHIAITMPTREAWLEHLEYLQKKGVKFDRRVEHGMTHSLYIHDPNGYGVEFVYDLPREVWQDDIEGALNYVEDAADRGPRGARGPRRGRAALQAAGRPPSNGLDWQGVSCALPRSRCCPRSSPRRPPARSRPCA